MDEKKALLNKLKEIRQQHRWVEIAQATGISVGHLSNMEKYPEVFHMTEKSRKKLEDGLAKFEL